MTSQASSSSPTLAARRAPVGFVVVLLLLSFAGRLGLAEYLLTHARTQLPDTELYTRYAETLFEGRPYDVSGAKAQRAPGYPAFLASCWTLAGKPSSRAVLYAQALLGALTPFFVFLIGRNFEQRGLPTGTALLAFLFALFEPYNILLGALELSETLFTFLFTVACWLATLTSAQRIFVPSVGAGLFLGLATLTRPSILLLAPVALIGLLGARCPVARRLALGGTLGLLVTVAPWWIRNAIELGAFVPTTTNVGESLYDGLRPSATGASDMSFKNDPALRGLSELEKDAHWRREALMWAKDHPREVMALTVTKLARYWSPWPNDASFRTAPIVIMTTLLTLPIYLGALFALARHARDPGSARGFPAIALGPILYFCLLHLIFVSSVRYRAAAMPLFALWAARGWIARKN